MSKMSELALDIEERLIAGEKPEDIAVALEVPLDWIEVVAECAE